MAASWEDPTALFNSQPFVQSELAGNTIERLLVCLGSDRGNCAITSLESSQLMSKKLLQGRDECKGRDMLLD